MKKLRVAGGLLSATALLLAIVPACAAQERTLWHDPGEIERINFAYAPGGPESAPRPPFYFIAEDFKGNNPKVYVRDSAGVRWRVKGGVETNGESFSTRLVAAVGYYVEPTWFVVSGTIKGARSLKRAARLIHPDGSFSHASFERRDPAVKSVSQAWAWNANPFVGTEQLNGLKVLVMLLADWDNKDARDQRIGSNTGIAESRTGGQTQLIYRVTDWGQTLGGWGPRMKPKAWDCTTFTAQTKGFVQGRDGPHVRFGFTGQHTSDFKNDITVENVRWLMRYLGRVTDAQILSGLKASGATPAEAACFGTQLRDRIRQLSAW
jgi:hypothetical protein